MIELLYQSLREEWQRVAVLAPRALIALVVLFLAIWLGRRARRLLTRLLDGRIAHIQRNFVARAAGWAVILIGLAVVFNLLGLEAASTGLLAGGGLTAVALGFAFREIGENFLAGFVLAFSRPFKIDDLIQSGDFKGQVRSIELRQTHIRTSDGRDIFIPNSQIINTALTNFTKDGMLRPVVTIGIDYGDDISKARRLLLAAVKDIEGVEAEPAPTIIVKSLEAAYVELEIAVWVDTFRPGVSFGEVRSQVANNAKTTLRAAGFTLSSDVTTSLVLSRAGEPPDQVEDDSKLAAT